MPRVTRFVLLMLDNTQYVVRVDEWGKVAHLLLLLVVDIII